MANGAPPFTPAEKEVIYLYSVQSLADELMSAELFEVQGTPGDAMAMFPNSITERLFFILLVDLLSPVDDGVVGEKKPYLRALYDICHSPNFEVENSKALLVQTVTEFRAWLTTDIEFDIHLAELRLQAKITLRRVDIAKLAGDILKHNVTRLMTGVRTIVEAMRVAGHTISGHDTLRCLDSIEHRFCNDIMQYHRSTLAEFVNNLRWGIDEYLTPEYTRAFRFVPEPDFPDKYEFDVPTIIKDEFAIGCYWALLNGVRMRPNRPKFVVGEIWKRRH